jgi:hypothetical protein
MTRGAEAFQSGCTPAFGHEECSSSCEGSDCNVTAKLLQHRCYARASVLLQCIKFHTYLFSALLLSAGS